MKVVAAFLANHIEMHDALLFVSGGWPEWWNISEPPCTALISLGMVVEFAVDDLGKDFPIEIVLNQPDKTLGTIQWPISRPWSEGPPEAPYYGQYVANINYGFEEVGLQVIEIRDATGTLATVKFVARLAA